MGHAAGRAHFLSPHGLLSGSQVVLPRSGVHGTAEFCGRLHLGRLPNIGTAAYLTSLFSPGEYRARILFHTYTSLD